ncbi:hypothetical protein HanLR1_Chr05g0180431 [Helianthus annuus]|nr:hypothetical protein HanHA89_Chr05g0191001 [Helianthus annuus]KAJ0750314.1 hypothetical protein HanLR1_Chr05g0180431 [Helianthus annuus]
MVWMVTKRTDLLLHVQVLHQGSKSWIMFRGESMEGKWKRDEEACTKRTLEVSDSDFTS